jgi:hypothetical protein
VASHKNYHFTSRPTSFTERMIDEADEILVFAQEAVDLS